MIRQIYQTTTATAASRRLFFITTGTDRRSFNTTAAATYTKSSTAMFSRQAEVPKLPVPALADTCAGLVRNVGPLLTDVELIETETAITELLAPGGAGSQLQARLKERAAAMPNYLDNWWEQAAYLGYRAPVLLNSNPAMCFESAICDAVGAQPGPGAQIPVAARCISGAMAYAISVRDQTMATELGPGKIPLCMEQHTHIAGACRVPEPNLDRLATLLKRRASGAAAAAAADVCDSVVVACRGQFWSLRVLDTKSGGGRLLPEPAIAAGLEAVVRAAEKVDINDIAAPHVGIFTAWDRDNWATARTQMCAESPVNVASLAAIESAAFVLCLDEASPTDGSALCAQALHGNGCSTTATAAAAAAAADAADAAAAATAATATATATVKGETANRWFDKPLSIIVGGNGFTAFNTEHTAADGMAYISVLTSILKCKPITEEVVCTAAAAEYRRLNFELGGPESALRSALATATTATNALTDNIELCCFKFSEYAKPFIKGCRMSPDGYFQMALQVAYFRQQGCFTSTYESASMRHFLHGRTETIRPLSAESCAFVRQLCATSDGDKQQAAVAKWRVDETERKTLAGMLRAAVETHSRYIKRVMHGQGVDRHLLGLRLAAREMVEEAKVVVGGGGGGFDTPALLSGRALAINDHIGLSTSQVPTQYGFIAFGPVVQDGFGVCYSVNREAEIAFTCSAWRSCKDTNAASFGHDIQQALRDMHDIMDGNQDVPAPVAAAGNSDRAHM